MSDRGSDEEHEHEGSFAEGQEEQEHHPEVEAPGDFAEGQEIAKPAPATDESNPSDDAS